MKTALISVYYKDKLADFAKDLIDQGWRILSTGGTKAHLIENGIEVTDVSEVTNFPEILDGRVKTLSPQVFGGILYRRDSKDHVETIKEHEIESIDMVVNMLYPFEETLANPDSTESDIIEKIDIGGPSMIRAAAKNHKDVYIVTSPDQYERVIEAIKNDEGEGFRKELAKEAFITTAAYDMAIANYFQADDVSDLFFHFEKDQELRYGENSHQKASYYKDANTESLGGLKLYQGKELSFNNIQDITCALEFIDFFDEPTAIGIKHNNPSGIASSKEIFDAYKKCIDADSESIFGGIVIVNEEIGEDLAKEMTSFFLEIVIGPSISQEALEIFKSKPNLRVVEYNKLNEKDYQFKEAFGGLLVQDRDLPLYEELKVAGKNEPSQEELDELLFAYKCVKCLKSNAIAITKDKKTLGLGIGDVNRYFAVSHAIEMAGEDAKGAVAASDGFFPFDDGVKAFHKAGVKSVIQPGGSVKDEDSIKFVDENDMSMVFTGMRHFRH